LTEMQPLPPTFVRGFHDEATVRAMPYRALGGDGRLVSLLSFGASSLSGSFRADCTEAESCAVVVAAVKSGINVIDTAAWYGHGESERILGRALQAVPREAYYIHTKCCRYLPAVLEQFDFTYDRTVRSVEESLERLQLDYIDTVQVHDPEFAPSPDVVLTEVLPALAALQAAGKIRRIGITGYPLDILRYLADNAPAGVVIDTAISYCQYNLHTTKLVDSGTLAHLRDLGIGVICASPLSMGLLTARGPPAWHPASAALRARCAAAAAFCTERGVDIATLALHFALFSSADIATILVGTASLARLEHDIAVAKGQHPLSPTETAVLAEVRERFFSGAEAEAVSSWEGREVAEVRLRARATLARAQRAALTLLTNTPSPQYWVKVGKIERTAWTIAHAKYPSKIAPPDSVISHVLEKKTSTT
jgi:L-galactose dehydrogenase